MTKNADYGPNVGGVSIPTFKQFSRAVRRPMGTSTLGPTDPCLETGKSMGLR